MIFSEVIASINKLLYYNILVANTIGTVLYTEPGHCCICNNENRGSYSMFDSTEQYIDCLKMYDKEHYLPKCHSRDCYYAVYRLDIAKNPNYYYPTPNRCEK